MSKDEITQLTDDTPEQPQDPGIIKTDIAKEMQKSYLDYAMSVIVSRALPDVRDGLKPVQRRIIYAMQEQNMTSSGKFHKSATVVGRVIGHYHPHGEAAVYDAMVRMGQDWVMRYPWVWPQGNFGDIDGDPPAAQRYTEAKLQKMAEELYKDIQHDTVDFVLNDLQNSEPIYLPSAVPNMLLNGAAGIAVGMATNIPPHNLNEVVDGMKDMIKKAETIGKKATKNDAVLLDLEHIEYYVNVAKTDFSSTATIEDLIEFIQGPDFPTGGTIYDKKEMIQMYATGRGRVVTRAKMTIEDMKGGKTRIIVTEIPYQVNKATLIEKIATLAKAKKIVGISYLRDESSKRGGMRIVIELKRDAIVKKVQNQLYKHTQLQNTFNTNMVALLNNEPQLMTLKVILEEFIKHRQQVIVRRTLNFLKKNKAREHILAGLKIALDSLDEVIKLIRSSKDVESAKNGLIKNFKLSAVQAQAILDMQLRRLAALERQKIEDELKEVMKTIKDFEALVASPERIMEEISKELEEIKDKYGDERKTKVVKGKLGSIEESDLVPNEKCIITISQSGYIKRMKEDTYKKQGRGGKGVKGQDLKDEDAVETIKTCHTHDYALFFSNRGKVYKLRVWEIPETSRQSKGTALVNFLSISSTEKIQDFFVLSNEELAKGKGHIVFGTKQGTVKKTKITDFSNIRTSGIAAIKLKDGDSLTYVNYLEGEADIMMITSMGMSIRFDHSDIRSMGRVATGVRGVNLKKDGDSVIGMALIPKESKEYNLLIVSEGGYGKKTDVREYKVQNRGGSGVLTYKVTPKTGKLVTGRAVHINEKTNILIATEEGKFIRLEEKSVPQLGRATMGVKLIRLNSGDKVTSVAKLVEETSETN